MHTDEAVHAVKFAELLEEGYYKYDPIEFHGPTLNYFTLISAYLSGEKTFTEINEYTLRLVPAIISLMLIFFVLTLIDKNNFNLILIIILLLTFSPVVLFYSRYYIQEILLVTFTYSSVLAFYKYFQTKKKLWIISSAILTGLIFATKETSIITFFSATGAIIVLWVLNKDIRKSIHIKLVEILLFLFVFALISALFYSSFFTNPSGIFDSILTFGNYFNKAGNNIIHSKPWYYYLNLMLLTKNNLLFYTSIPISIFSIIGIYFSFSNKHKISKRIFFQFIAVFSLLQASIYSIISYKTPWLVLNFWVGFLFLAAFGIFEIQKLLKGAKLKHLMLLVILLVFIHNLYQSFVTSFQYPYQAENPFTYSQPTPQVIRMSNKILNITAAKKNTLIAVIAKDNDYWPLPWYLRKINNVAWYNYVPDKIYKFPIIITSPNFEDEIVNKLYSIPPPGERNLYLPLFDKRLTIRPSVEMLGYIQKDYNDLYLRLLDGKSLK